jgi:hypothetical protein
MRRFNSWLRRQTLKQSARLLLAGVLLAATGCVVTGSTASGQAGPVLRLLPPSDGESYFGFTFRLWDTSDPAQGDARPFAERMRDSVQRELAGKTPTFLTVWAPWQYPDQPGKPLVSFRDPSVSDFVAKTESITGAHGLLYLDWNLSSTTAGNGGITTKDIASGSLDAYIRQYARDLKEFGNPVLVRLFGGEFNGSWWYGQSPRANPSLTSGDFVSAWRRVVDIFRQTGALNVSWAWIPNVFPPTSVAWVDPDIAAYYPGDDYVGWVGADIEDFAAPNWLDPIYSYATAHAKPFLLAEFGLRFDGSTLSPAQDQAWLASMFDYFESHPDIKAINYFNYNSRPDHGIPWDSARAVYLYDGQVNYVPNVNDDDQRLLAEGGADFRGTYSRGIANPRYVTAIRTEASGSTETASATLTSVRVRGIRATVRWRGNETASTFDVGLRQIPGGWKTVVTRNPAHSYTVRGRHRTRYSVRVRARDASGAPGPWTAPSSFRFP